MDTQRAQFDSHRFVKRLTKAGLSEEVAEVLADEHTRLIVPDDVATTGDVAAVGTRVATVQAGLATKAETKDVETVHTRLATVQTELTTVQTELTTVQAVLTTVQTTVQTELTTVQAELTTVQAVLVTVQAEMVTKDELRREIAACEQRMRNALLETKVSLIKWMITTMMVFSGIVIGAVTALQ